MRRALLEGLSTIPEHRSSSPAKSRSNSPVKSPSRPSSATIKCYMSSNNAWMLEDPVIVPVGPPHSIHNSALMRRKSIHGNSQLANYEIPSEDLEENRAWEGQLTGFQFSRLPLPRSIDLPTAELIVDPSKPEEDLYLIVEVKKIKAQKREMQRAAEEERKVLVANALRMAEEERKVLVAKAAEEESVKGRTKQEAKRARMARQKMNKKMNKNGEGIEQKGLVEQKRAPILAKSTSLIPPPPPPPPRAATQELSPSYSLTSWPILR